MRSQVGIRHLSQHGECHVQPTSIVKYVIVARGTGRSSSLVALTYAPASVVSLTACSTYILLRGWLHCMVDSRAESTKSNLHRIAQLSIGR